MMDKNQTIYRKLANKAFAERDVNTSFLLFPLRIETRFMEKEVENVDELDRIYYTFGALWRLILKLGKKNSDCTSMIEEFHKEVDILDIAYEEDKVNLLSLMDSLIGLIPEKSRQEWKEIRTSASGIDTLQSVSPKECEKVLANLNKAYNRFHTKPFDGMLRKVKNAPYSSTACEKAAKKHHREAFDLIDDALDNSNRIKSIPLITRNRIAKVIELIQENEVFEKETKANNTNSRYSERFEEFERYLAKLPELESRYTNLATALMKLEVDRIKSGKKFHQSKNIPGLQFLVTNAVCNFSDELNWVKGLYRYFLNHFEGSVSFGEVSSNTPLFKKRSRIIKTERKKCLCVRIYPDEIAVTQQLRPLSKQEYDLGVEFWSKYKKTSDPEERYSYWQAISQLLSPSRAAWVVRKTYPVNGAFPKEEDIVCTADENQIFSVPYTEILPHRFMLQAEMKTHEGQTRKIWHYGHRLPDKLQIGLDLNNLNGSVSQGQNGEHVKFSGAIRWMTDYDEAEKMGMAITLPLDTFRYERLSFKEATDKAYGRKVNTKMRDRLFNFESIYITGINTESADECSQALTNLLESHLYSSDGYDLIKIGTATNILDSDQDGDIYDTSDSAQEKRYYNQVQNLVNKQELEKDSDLAIIKNLFTLDQSVLQNIQSENPSHEVSDSKKVNEILVTKLLESKFQDVDANSTNLKEFKDYVVNDVLPNGPFPPLRIGKQPYGILPICDFSNLYFEDGSMLALVKEIVLYFTDKWNTIVDTLVTYNGEKTDLSSADYFKTIASTPNTVSYWTRQCVKGNGILNSDVFKSYGVKEDQYSDNQYKALASILSKYFQNFSSDDLKNLLSSYSSIPISDKDYFVRTIGKDELDISDIISDDLLKEKFGDDQPTKEKVKELTIEFFDLFSHRLDAWLMGLLNNKLRKRISEGKHKIAIGSYGWVFNLVEESAAAKKQKSDEYILAPSLNQAVTASVLRSAYNNSVKSGKRDYDMSVNLSSSRVRSAIRIIEGIQNGLSVGQILGSDLEQLLHEEYKTGQDMNAFIYPLRQKYPLVSDEAKTKAAEDITDNDISVINAAALLEDYREDKENFAAKIAEGVMQKTATDYKAKKEALAKIIDVIDDEYDALTDVVLSESVYKLTEGNVEAMSALVNALDEEKNIPIPEVTEIPMKSAQVDGSFVVALDPEAQDKSSMLSFAEPKIESWLRQMVGESILSKLNVSASELVYLSSDKTAFMKYLELKNGLDSSDDTLKKEYEEAEIAIDGLREALSNARILRNNDFIKETGVTENPQYEDLSSRYASVKESVQHVVDGLDSFLSTEEVKASLDKNASDYQRHSISDQSLQYAFDLLKECFAMGRLHALNSLDKKMLNGDRTLLTDATPFLEAVRLQHTLLESLTSLFNALKQDINDADNMVAAINAETEKPWSVYASAIQKLLLGSFLVVPNFIPDENVPVEVLSKQKKEGFFTNIDSIGVEEQIEQMAQVSENMMNFHQGRMYQKWNSPDDSAEIVPMQIPLIDSKKKQQWLGTEVSDESYVCDAFTYLVLNPGFIPSDRGQAMAGIVLDHWIERIPYKSQTAGLAFNYDQPDAEAPQALLLAVSTKDNDSYWSEELLLRTIRSSMHMIKCRAVDPDAMSLDSWTSGLFPLVDMDDLKVNSK